MIRPVPRKLLLALPIVWALLACNPSVVQNTSQEGSALSRKKKSSPLIMCMWNAYGKSQYVCSKKEMKEAQKNCDERATKQRGDKSTCSCTDDPNYIKDMCDDGFEPPVNSRWTRR